jgi:hypothetical protein
MKAQQAQALRTFVGEKYPTMEATIQPRHSRLWCSMKLKAIAWFVLFVFLAVLIYVAFQYRQLLM